MSALFEEECELMLMTFPSRVSKFDSKTKVNTTSLGRLFPVVAESVA
jgi:hypothetical protein